MRNGKVLVTTSYRPNRGRAGYGDHSARRNRFVTKLSGATEIVGGGVFPPVQNLYPRACRQYLDHPPRAVRRDSWRVPRGLYGELMGWSEALGFRTAVCAECGDSSKGASRSIDRPVRDLNPDQLSRVRSRDAYVANAHDKGREGFIAVVYHAFRQVIDFLTAESQLKARAGRERTVRQWNPDITN